MRFSVLPAASTLLLAAASVSVQLEQGSFVVRGWTAASPPAGGWEAVLSVYAGTDKDLPPMLGEYSIREGNLSFRPRYEPAAGMRVRVVFQGAEYYLATPARTVMSLARVVHVYPTSTDIPENQLKFYIEFSRPMSRGAAWKHIRLLKVDGTTVELPFLEIDQEMWDATTQRLTILFDPGRIKRGVKPLEDIGPAIEAGHSYALVIDREWPDAEGAPLISSYRREFRVGPADREPIDPAKWKFSRVVAGTRQALIVTFPEPLDVALATRLIRVRGIEGRASLSSEEREWRFEPERPWREGRYLVQVDSALEDLAGNKVGRLFDVDTFDRVSRQVSSATTSVPFRVGRQKR